MWRRKLRYNIFTMWQRKRRNCGFWDCSNRIPDSDSLCDEHYQSWVDGFIDRCPKCGRFKDIAYRLCQDCYFGRPDTPWKAPAVIPTPKQQHKIEYSSAWIDGYLQPDKFFVYILELDDDTLYVGHTADLYKQLSQYREQKTSSTPGHNAKLRYVQIVATQSAAELREAELKKLINSNPEQIHLMILDFHSHMREFGLEENSLVIGQKRGKIKTDR